MSSFRGTWESEYGALMLLNSLRSPSALQPTLTKESSQTRQTPVPKPPTAVISFWDSLENGVMVPKAWQQSETKSCWTYTKHLSTPLVASSFHSATVISMWTSRKHDCCDVLKRHGEALQDTPSLEMLKVCISPLYMNPRGWLAKILML